MKKTLALVIAFLVLGFALATAQEQTATKSQEKARIKTGLKAKGETQANKVQTKSEFRHRNRIAFIDENCDGINDVAVTASADAKAGNAYQLARDDDGDGIPNGQDPDWAKPEDGSGYKSRHKNGRPAETGMAGGQKSGKAIKSSFGKGSFRAGMRGAGRMAGAGAGNGTGPKGGTPKKSGR